MSKVQKAVLSEEGGGKEKVTRRQLEPEIQSRTDSEGYRQLKGKCIKVEHQSRNNVKLTNRFEILTKYDEIPLQTEETVDEG